MTFTSQINTLVQPLIYLTDRIIWRISIIQSLWCFANSKKNAPEISGISCILPGPPQGRDAWIPNQTGRCYGHEAQSTCLSPGLWGSSGWETLWPCGPVYPPLPWVLVLTRRALITAYSDRAVSVVITHLSDSDLAGHQGWPNPMLVKCWPSVVDAGPIFIQHWINVLCLLRRVGRTPVALCHSPASSGR